MACSTAARILLSAVLNSIWPALRSTVGDHEIPQVGGVRDQVIPHPAIT
jgi:hypothetical protein